MRFSRFPRSRSTATVAAIVTVPNRILSLLLCLLAAGPMSLPAWALARPENRVGDSFSSPLQSASADRDQTLGKSDRIKVDLENHIVTRTTANQTIVLPKNWTGELEGD